MHFPHYLGLSRCHAPCMTLEGIIRRQAQGVMASVRFGNAHVKHTPGNNVISDVCTATQACEHLDRAVLVCSVYLGLALAV